MVRESAANRAIEALTRREATIAVAESLTGGLLASELISVPGASVVVQGGVVAYATELKARLLGVDAALLDRVGAVDAEVARQMARGARERLGPDSSPATYGLATTGVAGPEPQDGHAPGVAFIALASASEESVRALRLHGDRAAIRRQVVSESLLMLIEKLAE